MALRPTQGSDGNGETVELDVQGPKLLLTADSAPSGSVSVAVRAVTGSDIWSCDPISNMNVTDYTLTGCNFESHIGNKVVIAFSITGGASVYTFAWAGD